MTIIKLTKPTNMITPEMEDNWADEERDFGGFGGFGSYTHHGGFVPVNQSYTNPKSQGSLIAQTRGFPDEIDGEKFVCHSAYSDRLHGWDSKHFEELCLKIGGGDQIWKTALPGKSDKALKEIGKLAFKADKKPVHVRAIYYFNVSSGYDCPVILAIFKK